MRLYFEHLRDQGLSYIVNSRSAWATVWDNLKKPPKSKEGRGEGGRRREEGEKSQLVSQLNPHKNGDKNWSRMNINRDQQDGSADKGACQEVWQPKFNPWETHSGRREPIPASCPWNTLMHSHTQIKCNNILKILKRRMSCVVRRPLLSIQKLTLQGPTLHLHGRWHHSKDFGARWHRSAILATGEDPSWGNGLQTQGQPELHSESKSSPATYQDSISPTSSSPSSS